MIALKANNEVPKMETVTERLLYEKQKVKERMAGSRPGNEEAMTIKHNKRRGPRYHHCKRYGHIKRNCRELQGSNYDNNHRGGMKPHKVNNVETAGTPDDNSYEVEAGLVVNHALSAENISSNTYWIVDSGATSHVCNDKKQFVRLYPLKHSVEVKLGDGRNLMATAQGDVSLRMKYGSNKSRKCTLNDVLYVPELSYNLVSASKAVEKENTVKFSDFGCTIRDKKGRLVAVETKVGGLYRVDVIHSVDVNTVEMNNHRPLTKEDLWHHSLVT